MSAIPTVTLNDGHPIPQLGFGVFQIEPDKTAEAVKTALDIGYRHIDTWPRSPLSIVVKMGAPDRIRTNST